MDRRSFLVAACGVALACRQARAATAAADLILVNGRVYSGEPRSRWAEAVAIKHGTIAYVGSRSGARALQGQHTQLIDLGGRLLLPAFIDPHNHVYRHGIELFWVVLGSRLSPHTVEGYRQSIVEYRARHPGLRQIRGSGFDPWILPAIGQSRKRQPRELLDDIVGDVPAAFLSWTGHTLWANSKAIELAGVTRDTPDPPGAQGAQIERDPATGEPNGIFHEHAAHNLILEKLPERDLSVEQHRAAVLSWQRELASRHGVTGALVPTHYTAPNFFTAMQQLSDEGALTARYDVAQWADDLRGVDQVPALVACRARFHGGRRFNLRSIKIYAPWPQDELNRTIAALDALGFRVFVHNVGSTQSYAAVLDAFEYALRRNGPRDSRHVITHVRAEAAPLAARFKALGVRADADWHPAPKSFYDAGVPATLSSDYPVRDMSPLEKIAEGVKSGLSLDALLDSATLRGAQALFAERETGSVAAGKSADLVVLDRDLFEVAPDDIAAARPLLTLFAGKELYRDPTL